MSRYISNSHVCEIHGRGEWSRVYDACMVVRVYFPRLRASCMPRLTYVCPRRLKTRHPYHLGGVFWYGSSISIIIYLSLIRGISSVADGENVCFKLALKQGFSALVTVECMHAGVSRAVSQASVVLKRPGYGFSQAFCWCSFAGTLTSQASPAPIKDSSRTFSRRNRASCREAYEQ